MALENKQAEAREHRPIKSLARREAEATHLLPESPSTTDPSVTITEHSIQGTPMSQSHNFTLFEHRMTVPGEHEFISVRSVEDLEAEQISAATDLINQVALSRYYRRLIAIADIVEAQIDAIEDREDPGEAEVAECHAALHALCQANREFCSGTLELLAAQLHEPGAPEVEAVVEDHLSGPESPWRSLERIETATARLALDRSHQLGIREGDEFDELQPLVASAIEASETLFGDLLLALAGEIGAAATLLRALHAECPQGAPVLVAADQFPNRHGEDLKMPHDLPIHMISEALRLLRTAELIAGEESSAGAPRWTLSDDELQSAIADEEDLIDERHEASGRAGADEAERHFEQPAITDLPGLLGLARGMSDALLEAWSGALDRALNERGIEDQMAAVRAAITGFHQAAAERGDRLKEFPPGPELIAELEKNPDQAGELATLAQLQAFVDLVEGLSEFTEPSRVQMRFNQQGLQKVERFWQSGGLATLGSRLELMRYLIEPRPDDQEQCELLDAERRLRLSVAAYRRGDPEGSLFHAVCALAVAEKRPLADLAETLPDSDQRTSAEAGLRLVQRQLEGEANLALSLLVAPTTNDLIAGAIAPFSGERSLSGEEMYELFSPAVPFVDLGQEQSDA